MRKARKALRIGLASAPPRGSKPQKPLLAFSN